jgi:hypothetical protein
VVWQLSASTNISLYNELLSLELYYEFIGFSALSCPSLLLEENHQLLFSEFVSYRLLLPIHRDLVSNLFSSASLSPCSFHPLSCELNCTLWRISLFYTHLHTSLNATHSLTHSSSRHQSVSVHVELERVAVFLDSSTSTTTGTANNTVTAATTVSARLSNNKATTAFHPTASLPRLPRLLKQLARQSLAQAPLRMRARRLVLLQELTVCLQLLAVSPSLVAPKLPMLLSLGALLKSDLMAFFRHFTAFPVRKDCKSSSHYDPSTFGRGQEEIAEGLHRLSSLQTLIRHREREIIEYYLEFLYRTDSERLLGFESLFGDSLASSSSSSSSSTSSSSALHVLFHSLAQSVESLHLYHCENTAEIARVTRTQRETYWQLVLLSSHSSLAVMMTMNNTSNNSSPWDQCLRLLGTICEQHAVYITACDRERELVERLSIYPAVWFRPVWLSLFTSTLQAHSLSPSLSPLGGVVGRNRELGMHAMHYLRVLEDVLCNLSPVDTESTTNNNNNNGSNLADKERKREREREQEIKELGEPAVLLANTMLRVLVDVVLKDVDVWWTLTMSLNAQHHPTQTVMQVNGASGGGIQSFTPGMESAFWATEQMHDFAVVRERFTSLLAGIVHALPPVLTVYTRQYNVQQYLCESLAQHFRAKVLAMCVRLPTASTATDEVAVYRFSRSWSRLMHLVHTFFDLADRLPLFSAAGAARSLWTHHLFPAEAVSPLGCSLFTAGDAGASLSSTASPSLLFPLRETVVGQVAAWFRDVATALSSPDCGVVYRPASAAAASASFLSLARWQALLAKQTNGVTSASAAAAAAATQTNLSLSMSSPASSFAKNNSSYGTQSVSVELFLSQRELVSLARVIGLQGVRVCEAGLVAEMVAQLTTLVVLLQRDADLLVAFAQRLQEDVSSVLLIPHLNECIQIVRKIAVCLILREVCAFVAFFALVLRVCIVLYCLVFVDLFISFIDSFIYLLICWLRF